MSNTLSYREIRPAKALQKYIYCYWSFSYNPPDPQNVLDHSIPPDGCTSLVFPYHPQLPIGQASILGPQTSVYRIPVFAGSKCLGVRFMPGAVSTLFGVSPKDWIDQNIDAAPFLPEFPRASIFRHWPRQAMAAEWLDLIFSGWIKEKSPVLDEQILEAVHLILKAGGNIKVADLAAQVFISKRQFQRRFLQEVGLSPKIFCRIRRMRAALVERLLQEKPYPDILFDHGYTDKSHFNRDFSSITGLSSADLEKYLSQIEHLGMD